jgi:hypothetical protein
MMWQAQTTKEIDFKTPRILPLRFFSFPTGLIISTSALCVFVIKHLFSNQAKWGWILYFSWFCLPLPQTICLSKVSSCRLSISVLSTKLLTFLSSSCVAAGPQFKILLTGFLPFRNYTVNPSQIVAQTLASSCYDSKYSSSSLPDFQFCFDSWVLPVNNSGSTRVENFLTSSIFPFLLFSFSAFFLTVFDFSSTSFWLSHAGWSNQYDAVIHMGLEDSAKGICLEVAGANIRADSK